LMCFAVTSNSSQSGIFEAGRFSLTLWDYPRGSHLCNLFKNLATPRQISQSWPKRDF